MKWYFACVKLLAICFLLVTLPYLVLATAMVKSEIGNNSQQPRVALVLGAAVYCNLTDFASEENAIREGLYDCYPSNILQKRLDAAIELYEAKKVKYILVSGDNRSLTYNEPAGMLRYLKEKNIPDEAVVPDFAGLSTFDSCWRAKHVFHVDSAYVVTQTFHLPKSVFLCENQGISVVPVQADNSSTDTIIYGITRELAAGFRAVYDVFSGKTAQVKGSGNEQNLGE